MFHLCSGAGEYVKGTVALHGLGFNFQFGSKYAEIRSRLGTSPYSPNTLILRIRTFLLMGLISFAVFFKYVYFLHAFTPNALSFIPSIFIALIFDVRAFSIISSKVQYG